MFVSRQYSLNMKNQHEVNPVTVKSGPKTIKLVIMNKIFLFFIFSLLCDTVLSQDSVRRQTAYSVREKTEIVSLNGTWDFKYILGEKLPNVDTGFYEPGFQMTDWGKINVPSHWEIAGKSRLRYGWETEAGRGLYRTFFTVPGNWEGKHVFIRFDGVLYGYKLYVNGRFAGEWNSSFNPCQFDITPFINRDGPNLLAVDVTNRSKGWEFDTNDCWGLTGIFRDVELFPVPELHFRDLVFRSYLSGDNGALLNFDVDVSAFNRVKPGSKVQITLFDQAMRNICSFSESIVPGKENYRFEKEVRNVNCWTAETPYLYTMTAKILDSRGRVVQQVREKVGIREISIENGIFLVNRKPVLLRGICSFEIDPRVGRALTDYEILQDLTMMKAADVNFIRTASYPHHPRFLELCDEMGFYVACEVPFGFGEKHLTDPDYQIDLYNRAEATLTRDKNRPSVIFWTVGNENPYTSLVEKTLMYVKEKDPTRPRATPSARLDFLRDWTTYSDNIDIYAFHYPAPELLDSLAPLLKKPVILTEYSHSLGLAFEHLEAVYDRMLKYDHFAGGSIWHWADQGILMPKTRKEFLADDAPVMGVWKDTLTYYNSYGDKGTDGIVYSDRYPSEDLWYMRKVYSPFIIHNKEFTILPGRQRISLEIENRFDFTSMQGYQIKWQLKGYRESFASGTLYSDLSPRKKGTLELDLTIPSRDENVFWLEMACISPSGIQVYEKNITLYVKERLSYLDVYRTGLSSPVKIKRKSGNVFASESYSFALGRDGRVVFKGPDGQPVIDGLPVLRVGRKPSISTAYQTIRRKKAFYWNPYLLTPRLLSHKTENTTNGISLEVKYRWDRQEKPEEYVDGKVIYRFAPDGLLEVTYELEPVNGTDAFLELGLGFELAANFDIFRWVGEGPFATTPGKNAFNEPGVWGLHKDDLRFSGNRADVDIALFSAGTSASGLGYIGNRNQLGVENINGTIVLTDNRWVVGYGTKSTKTGAGEKPVSEMGRVRGTFYLVPVNSKSPVFNDVFDPSKTIVPEIPFEKSYGF